MTSDPRPSPRAPPARAPYVSKLRARQKEQTASLILDSVRRLLTSGDLAAVTIAEVARTAEVTERTIYRYFPTREDLLRAFWRHELERTGGATVTAPQNEAELMTNIRRLFAGLDGQEGMIRALLATQEGRDLRRPTNAARLAHMQDFIAAECPGLDPETRLSLAAGIVSVSSVLSWMFLRDNTDMDGARAGEAAARTVQCILDAARRIANGRNPDQR